MPNNDKIREVMIHVTRHPERLDMNHWGSKQTPCGTTACLAGWAMLLNGIPHRWGATGELHLVNLNDDIEEVAGEILGLNYNECGVFYASDEQLWPEVEALTEGVVNRAEVEAYIAAHPE